MYGKNISIDNGTMTYQSTDPKKLTNFQNFKAIAPKSKSASCLSQQ
jgi:hypothetical protein